MIEPITILLIIFTCLISYNAFNHRDRFEKLKHYPYQEIRNKEYYRLLSAGFVHGDYIHLAVNMYVLYSFGSIVEYTFTKESMYGPFLGRIVFIILYLLNVVAASIPTLLKHKDNYGFSSVGASGAVSGLVFIYIALFPYQGIGFIFLENISFPAILMGIGYLIYSSYAAKKANSRIDHVAHFYGALFGIAFLWITRPHTIREFFTTLINDFPLFN